MQKMAIENVLVCVAALAVGMLFAFVAFRKTADAPRKRSRALSWAAGGSGAALVGLLSCGDAISQQAPTAMLPVALLWDARRGEAGWLSELAAELNGQRERVCAKNVNEHPSESARARKAFEEELGAAREASACASALYAAVPESLEFAAQQRQWFDDVEAGGTPDSEPLRRAQHRAVALKLLRCDPLAVGVPGFAKNWP